MIRPRVITPCGLSRLLTPCSHRDDIRGHKTTPDDTARHARAGLVRGASNFRIRCPKGRGGSNPPSRTLLLHESSCRRPGTYLLISNRVSRSRAGRDPPAATAPLPVPSLRDSSGRSRSWTERDSAAAVAVIALLGVVAGGCGLLGEAGSGVLVTRRIQVPAGIERVEIGDAFRSTIRVGRRVPRESHDRRQPARPSPRRGRRRHVGSTWTGGFAMRRSARTSASSASGVSMSRERARYAWRAK